MNRIELIEPIVQKQIQAAKQQLFSGKVLYPKLCFILLNPYSGNSFAVEIPDLNLHRLSGFEQLKNIIQETWARFESVTPKELPVGGPKLLAICFIIDSWRANVLRGSLPVEKVHKDYIDKYGSVENDPNKTNTIFTLVSMEDLDYVGFYDYEKPRIDAPATLTTETPLNFNMPENKPIIGHKLYPKLATPQP